MATELQGENWFYTRDRNKIERAKILRYCGIGKSGFEAAATGVGEKSRWWEYNIQEPFIKMLPTNIAAAIGLAQLDARHRRRRSSADGLGRSRRASRRSRSSRR